MTVFVFAPNYSMVTCLERNFIDGKREKSRQEEEKKEENNI